MPSRGHIHLQFEVQDLGSCQDEICIVSPFHYAINGHRP